ncbi:hypothetical protein JA1_002217 [Spathaspora sp. JA1]|nr:hypothetical protein JA1_002217 [Spathaspora sp. JA1]
MTRIEYDEGPNVGLEIPSISPRSPALHPRDPSLISSPDLIKRYQKKSRDKFLNKWSEIIDKYSHIDPLESDEIHLATGEIIVDNGHLKSLRVGTNESRRYLNDLIVTAADMSPKLDQKLSYKLSSPREISEDNLLLNPMKRKKKREQEPEEEEEESEDDSEEPDDGFDPSPTKGVVPFYKDDTSPIKKQRTTPKEDSFEEEYNIIIEPYYFLQPQPQQLKLYHCAIQSCQYVTGNKQLYKSHLLKTHSSILSQLGYPVTSSETLVERVKVDVDLLNSQCPSRYNIPPWRKPLTCGKQQGGSSCKMFFLNAQDLLSHQASSTCSGQNQVLVCPMLGCGYLTDGGYLEWRHHFISAMHCVPKDINSDLIIDISQRAPEEEVPEIEELFSEDEESDWEDIIASPSFDNYPPKASTPETSHTNSPK